MNQFAEAAMVSHPPQNLEAERAVLGSICLSEAAFDEVAEVLRSEHFFSENNRLIFEAVRTLNKRGIKIDAVQDLAAAVMQRQVANADKTIGQDTPRSLPCSG